MTLALLMAGLQIGSKFASEVVEDPKLKRRLAALSAGLGAGAQLGSLAGAFASPSTGLKIAGGKLGDLGESTGMINPKGFGAFDGALPKGISGAFGEGINKLPESLGGAFKNPGWNAPESIFNFNPGETKPFDWSLF